MQPLSDSTFVVAAGAANLNSSRIYLAYLRVPGLPRVIDSHHVPAATPLAARPGRGPGPALELYPNPAGEAVTVRCRLPAGVRAATLVFRDALGHCAGTAVFHTAEATVSVRALAAGLYHATVQANGQVLATGKLAVVR